MDLSDVRMVERCQHLGFALKTSHAIGIGGESRRQDLQSHLPFQPGVPGPVHLPHAAFAKLVHNLVVRDRLADQRFPFSFG